MTRDSFGYLDMARAFLESQTLDVVLPHRTPGYPSFLAAVIKIFGESGIAVNLLQSLAALLVGILAYKIFKTSVGIWPARLTAILCWIQPSSLVFENALMSESLTRTLLVLMVALGYFGLGRSAWWYSLSASLAGACAILIRPNAAVFVVIFLCGLIYVEGMKARSILLQGLVVGLGMLPVLLWVLFVGNTTGIWNLTANNEAGRFEGLQMFGIVAEQSGQLAQYLVQHPELAGITFDQPQTHYRNYNQVAEIVGKTSGKKGLGIYAEVENIYAELNQLITATPSTLLSTARNYSFLINIGLGRERQSDMPWYYEMLANPELRSRAEICEVYGNAQSEVHRGIPCVPGIHDLRRGALDPGLVGFFAKVHWIYARAIAFAAGLTGVAILIGIFRFPWLTSRARLWIFLGLALLSSALAHAYFLTASHRYFEVFAVLWILLVPGSFEIFTRRGSLSAD